MDRNIKRILFLTAILILAAIIYSSVYAVTIKETTNDSDKYDTIEKGSYIIGATKFTPDTIITGAVAAQAGANDMKLYIAKHGTAEGYEYPKVLYYSAFGKWKEYTSNGELKDANLNTTSFEIYYVDNVEKTGKDTATNEEIELPTIEKNEFAYSFINETTVVKVGTALEGEEITVPAAPTKDHYTFKGWYYLKNNELGNKVEPNSKIAITEDTVIVAIWEINKYTVRFLAEDGETVLMSHEFEYGTNLFVVFNTDEEVIEEYYEMLWNLPVKEGTEEYDYEFTGWDGNFDEENLIVSGDMTFIAKYEKAYYIQFLNDDEEGILWSGYVIEGELPEYIEYPERYGTPTKPATMGINYAFNGWDREVVPATAHATYTATYTTYVDVANLEELNAALLDDNIETINMIADITSGGIVEIPRPLTFNLNGHTLARNGGGATLNPYNVAGKVIINGQDDEGNIGIITNLNSQQNDRNTTAIYIDNDNNPDNPAQVEINDVELSGVNYGLQVVGDSNSDNITTEVVLNRVHIVTEDNLALEDTGRGVYCRQNGRVTINDSDINANYGITTSGGAQGTNKRAYSTINRTKINSTLNSDIIEYTDVACCVFGAGNSVTTMNDCNGENAFTGDVYIVAGNGSTSEAGAEFYINNCDLTSMNDVAMYMPGTEILSIIDSNLTGVGGLEACTGTITIAGSTIRGTGESLNIDANQASKGDGCWSDGSAIFIRAQRGYNNGGNLTLTIDDSLSNSNKTTKIQSTNGNGVRVYENINNTQASHGVDTVTLTGFENRMFTVNQNYFTANLNGNDWFTLTLNGVEIENTIELPTID